MTANTIQIQTRILTLADQVAPGRPPISSNPMLASSSSHYILLLINLISSLTLVKLFKKHGSLLRPEQSFGNLTTSPFTSWIGWQCFCTLPPKNFTSVSLFRFRHHKSQHCFPIFRLIYTPPTPSALPFQFVPICLRCRRALAAHSAQTSPPHTTSLPHLLTTHYRTSTLSHTTTLSSNLLTTHYHTDTLHSVHYKYKP